MFAQGHACYDAENLRQVYQNLKAVEMGKNGNAEHLMTTLIGIRKRFSKIITSYR